MHVKNRGEFVRILAIQTDRVLGGDAPDFHCSSFYSFVLLLPSSSFIISSQLAQLIVWAHRFYNPLVLNLTFGTLIFCSFGPMFFLLVPVLLFSFFILFFQFPLLLLRTALPLSASLTSNYFDHNLHRDDKFSIVGSAHRSLLKCEGKSRNSRGFI